MNETNRYYAQQGKTYKHGFTKWKPVTYNEVKAFIGILMAMGLTKLPEMRDYWRKGSVSHVPWFSSILTRGRFEAILNYLHLCNNEKHPPPEDEKYKLYKLGIFPDIINENFRKCYVPDRELSVDEQMIGTRCRVSFIQYMPKKPVKFGIKLWAICEAKTGYCLNFQIYKGKENDTGEKGLGNRVVMDLTEPYLDQNRHIYMDNFYSNPKLFSALEKRSTFACGTIRRDRGEFPPEFTKSKLQRGESVYLKFNKILAVHWFDKRDVFALSNIHSTGDVQVLRKGSDEPVSKPIMIDQYNQFMGGVDRCDQYLASYSMQRKTKKWWKKIFYRLIELSVINAYILFCHFNPEFSKRNRSHYRFRELLIHELVQPLLNDRADPNNVAQQENRGRPNDIDSTRLRGKHFAISRFPVRRTCTSCGYQKNEHNKQTRKKTCNYCEKCKLFICKQCFTKFHTKSRMSYS